jgi:hypothetical protein
MRQSTPSPTLPCNRPVRVTCIWHRTGPRSTCYRRARAPAWLNGGMHCTGCVCPGHLTSRQDARRVEGSGRLVA